MTLPPPAANQAQTVADMQRRAFQTSLLEETEWRKCKKSWWYWLNTYVYTKDENDPKTPFKRFFSDGVALPYVFLLGQMYLHKQLLIILKSRQMRVTWLFCALDLWSAMFHPGRFIPVTANKELDAADILQRIQFIFHGLGPNPDPLKPRTHPEYAQDVASRGLPEWMRARCAVKFMKEPFQMEFLLNGSLIRACPDGTEQLRGKTISRWRNEESRSQARLAESSQAVMPAARNGSAQVCYVSSAGPGYFQTLVEDRLDPGDPPPAKHYRVSMPGIQIWTNARNGFTVIRLHYTADPRKAATNWAQRTKRGLADFQWQMEFEIDFTARGGQPALQCFMSHFDQIVIPPFRIEPWWPRVRSADYGIRSPYSQHSGAIAPDGSLYIYWEYYSPGPLGMHLSMIKAQPDWDKEGPYILDRSCWAETQQTSTTVAGQTTHGVRSIAEMHQDYQVYPIPATVTRDEVKVEALWKVWNLDVGESPKVYIFATCTNLIRELPGIRWAERPPTILGDPSPKLVDKDNHAFDDLCYMVLHHWPEGVPQPATIQSAPADYVKEQAQATAHLMLLHLKRLDNRHEGTTEYGEDDEEYGYTVDTDLDG